ncbi:MAG: alpha-L-rhamnosidase, partial [Cellulomonadaceae bacterium]|nr:alpha-L-rhamnosidase [Cellulomonadaceae bacterium]
MSTAVVVESGASPGSVAVPRPRLSWTSVTDAPDWVQARAEVRLDDGASVVVDGRASVLVDWPFADLLPHARHEVRVRVTGVDGSVSRWSEPAPVRADFLAPGEWTASFLQLPHPTLDAQPARFRREFDVPADVVRATLFASALGVYQVRLNGVEVDEQVLKPGWTPYAQRLIHESTDVTALIRPGERAAIGIDLAGGWYTEGYFLPQPRYGSQSSVAAQLRLERADGTIEVVATDADWRSLADGPIVRSGLYAGEHHDATRETPGWDLPGFDDSRWDRVRFADVAVVPEARTSPAVRAVEVV